MEWNFSRNAGVHWVADGRWYKREWYLWEIRNCTPMGNVNQCHKDGYDLFHKGKKVKHGKTVKELKRLAG